MKKFLILTEIFNEKKNIYITVKQTIFKTFRKALFAHLNKNTFLQLNMKLKVLIFLIVL